MEALYCDKEKHALTIQELTIESQDVVEFLVEFEDVDKRLSVLRDMIRLGAKAYKSILTESYEKA